MEPGVIEEHEPTGGIVDDLGGPFAVGGGLLLVLGLVVVLGLFVRGRRVALHPAPETLDLHAPGDGAVEPGDPAEVAPVAEGLLARMQLALGRSRSTLREGLERILGRPIDEDALEVLEESLIRADVGVATTHGLLDVVREAAGDADVDLEAVLRAEMRSILDKVHAPLRVEAQPLVLLVVGVNGSGKTTTIGKLAHRFTSQGKRVMLAAGDTFRAAAAEQLQVWAERSGADFTRREEGSDPGAVVFGALEAAEAGGHDVVIIDTAGRLQTTKPLMEQLSKIRRVIQKRIPDGPHETLLVLDGTMGQNGMSQARLFDEATPLTGVAITKLDGTAKGGMVLAIASELQLPIKLVGLGEGAEDLRDFEPAAFVEALL